MVYRVHGTYAGLTRKKTPWLLRDVHWDEALRKQAVVWLARTQHKAILRLTAQDYAEHSLQARHCCPFLHPIKVLSLKLQ